MLAGAAATILAAFLPWVTLKGLTVTLDLGLVGAEAGAGNRTVSGTDTSLWPALVALGVVVAALALFGIARGLVLALGLLVTVAGGLLLVYMANVIEIETRGGGELERALKRALADALLSSSVGPGTPLLLAGGLAIVAGALLRRNQT
jgi:hypothetical protein